MCVRISPRVSHWHERLPCQLVWCICLTPDPLAILLADTLHSSEYSIEEFKGWTNCDPRQCSVFVQPYLFRSFHDPLQGVHKVRYMYVLAKWEFCYHECGDMTCAAPVDHARQREFILISYNPRGRLSHGT